MPTHKEVIATLCTTPPAALLERQEKSLHLFIEVLRAYGEDVALNKANDMVILKGTNFISHPMVHRGYYDEKYADVLYVYDYIDGKKIRKDESVLLSTGQFTHQKRPHIYTNYSLAIESIADGIKRAKNGDEKTLASFKDSFWYDVATGAYIPFNIDNFYLTAHLRNVASSIRAAYFSWCDATGVSSISDIAEDSTFNAFWQWLKVYKPNDLHRRMGGNYSMILLQASENLHRFYQCPKDMSFLGGWLIEDGHELGLNYVSMLREYRKPTLIVNQDIIVQWAEQLPNRAQRIINTEFFLAFACVCTAMTNSIENQRTSNNEGQLLSYSSKVNEFKKSFLMTTQETAIAAQWDKELLEARTLDKTHKRPAEHAPIFLGLELEVVARDHSHHESIVSDLANSPFGDHHISKSDGSIGSAGLEIVTIPATLTYHKEMLEKYFFAEPYRFHKRVMVTPKCGIHVHISKNAFTPLKLGQFMSFIFKNENQEFINAMAGREPNSYCIRKNEEPLPKLVMNACKNSKLKEGLNFGRDAGFNSHRDAVNVQNPHTVEVRIFKSSNNRNNVLRKLEFCDSLVRFVRSKGPKEDMSVHEYINFILATENKKEYPCIIKWLASKDFIGHTRKKIFGGKKLQHIYSENRVPKLTAKSVAAPKAEGLLVDPVSAYQYHVRQSEFVISQRTVNEVTFPQVEPTLTNLSQGEL